MRNNVNSRILQWIVVGMAAFLVVVAIYYNEFKADKPADVKVVENQFMPYANVLRSTNVYGLLVKTNYQIDSGLWLVCGDVIAEGHLTKCPGTAISVIRLPVGAKIAVTAVVINHKLSKPYLIPWVSQSTNSH